MLAKITKHDNTWQEAYETLDLLLNCLIWYRGSCLNLLLNWIKRREDSEDSED